MSSVCDSRACTGRGCTGRVHAGLRIALAGFGACIAACLAGCAGTQDDLFDPASKAARSTNQPPALLSSGHATLFASDLYPSAPGARTFRDQRGNTQRRETTRTAGDDRWTIVVRESSASDGESRISRRLTLSADGDGGVLLHRLEESSQKLVIEFEPPLMMCPRIPPIETMWESRATGRVVDDQGREKAARVPAHQQILIAAIDPESATHEIRTRLTLEADPAVVRRASITRLRPGAGTIEERETLEVRVAGIRIKNSDRTLLPEPAPGGAD